MTRGYHTSLSTHIDGRLIISEIEGPLNVSLVDAWVESYHAMAERLVNSGPHVALARVERSMLCSKQALTRLQIGAIDGAVRLRCLAQVIVATPTVEGRAETLQAMALDLRGVMPFIVFDALDPARSWSRSLLLRYGF